MDALVGLLLMAAAFLVLQAQVRGRIKVSKTRPVATVVSLAPAVVGSGKQPSQPAAAAPRPVDVPVGGGATRLFAYGEIQGGGDSYQHHGGYAAVALLAAGLNPSRDAVLELAIVRVDAQGGPEEEYHTLLNPAGRPFGSPLLHGISVSQASRAPQFTDVVAEVMDWLSGVVVVSHLADLTEQFLTVELLRAGVLIRPIPALSTARLGQQTFSIANTRLDTVAGYLGLSTHRTDTALGQARIVAAAIPALLARHGEQITYPVPPIAVGATPPSAPPVPRPQDLPAPSKNPWLTDLMRRLPMSALEAHDTRIAAYLDGLTTLLAQGRIMSNEVRLLVGQLATSGDSATQIRGVNQRLLESMRRAAFAGPSLSPTHLRQLRAAAISLGIPSYFDDLVPPPVPPAPEPGSGSFARPVRKPLPPAPPPRLPRCGRCLSTGHYTSDCPRRDNDASAVTPVSPIDW